MRYMISKEKALNLGLNHTHWDPDANSAARDRNNREREEEFAGYISTKTLLLDYMEKA